MNSEDDQEQQAEEQREKKRAHERKSISATTVHEAVRAEGEEELERPPRALAWSGLAAGLSIGFSLLAEGMLYAYLPATHWRHLISKLGYSLGFIIVILGRQQLFTENPLTTMLPLLHTPSLRTFFIMVRLWAIVLAANIIGAVIFAIFIGETPVLDARLHQACIAVSKPALEGGFGPILLRAIFAGWLIALVVWLLPAARGGAEIWVIWLLTYFIGVGGFAHVIAGSVEVLYLVTADVISWWKYVTDFFVPSLLGNIIGGVSLVAALNHAQVVAGNNEEQ